MPCWLSPENLCVSSAASLGRKFLLCLAEVFRSSAEENNFPLLQKQLSQFMQYVTSPSGKTPSEKVLKRQLENEFTTQYKLKLTPPPAWDDLSQEEVSAEVHLRPTDLGAALSEIGIS